MKLVSAGLDADADDPAHELAELSGRILGNHIELFNGVDTRRVADGVFRNLIIINSVQKKIVTLLAIAVDVRTPAVVSGFRASKLRRIYGNRARREQSQLNIVSSGQRKRL